MEKATWNVSLLDIIALPMGKNMECLTAVLKE